MTKLIMIEIIIMKNYIGEEALLVNFASPPIGC